MNVSDTVEFQRERADELVGVIMDALQGTVGWRARARALLGLTTELTCPACGARFPSGGKRRKSCGKTKCQLKLRMGTSNLTRNCDSCKGKIHLKTDKYLYDTQKYWHFGCFGARISSRPQDGNKELVTPAVSRGCA